MKASHFSKDTQEFLRLLAKEEVKYVREPGFEQF